ncbi:hypothetical protein Poly30_30900 [Planctomycetes bacterium Poly30]|uniref:DUF1573 domain-containing protein n=1 Tax=Saltatorellus ferox TaxID=2528018 RepID=A0A518ETZ3_9BACT|nr:hypothetical protein Poly30_30900 [Planctomycetes bacterium Poly30]
MNQPERPDSTWNDPKGATRRVAPLVLLALMAACGSGSEPDAAAGRGASEPPAYNPDGKGTIDLGGVDPVPGTPGAGLLEVIHPDIEERPLYKEFGDVPFGTDLEWATVLGNTGTAPVVITSAQAACGCTRFMDYTVTDAEGNRPAYPTAFSIDANKDLATVPAGGTILIRMKLMTKFSKPNQRKLALMRLSTDSVARPYLTFEVGFNPTRAFVFAPDRANLLNAPFSSGKSERTKILVDRGGNPGRVLGVLSTPEGIEAELVTETFGGEYVWYVNVTVPPLSPLGPIRGEVILKTTDENGDGEEGRLELPVVALVVPDVVATPNLAMLRAFDRTKGKEFTGRIAALVPGARIKIESAQLDSVNAEKFEVSYEPVKPFDDGRAIEWSYTIKVLPDHPHGFLSGDLVLKLEESFGGLPETAPQNELRIPLSGNARDPEPENS